VRKSARVGAGKWFGRGEHGEEEEEALRKQNIGGCLRYLRKMYSLRVVSLALKGGCELG